MHAIMYRLTCDRCGATAVDEMTAATGWVALDQWGRSTADGHRDRWALVAATLCPDCTSSYTEREQAIEDAQASALAFAGKSDLSGEGSEGNPYEFVAGVTCVLNAYYRHDGELYVYMPADAEPHAYDSWEAAEGDFAPWAAEAGSEEA